MNIEPQALERIIEFVNYFLPADRQIPDAPNEPQESPQNNPFGAIPEQTPAVQPLPDLQIPRIPAGDVDAAGVQWHPDLHSSSRAKTETGLWRARRGGPKVQPAAVVVQPPVTSTPNAANVSVAAAPPAVVIPNPVAVVPPVQSTPSLPAPSAPALNIPPPVKAVRVCTIGGEHEYTKDFFFSQLVPILSQLIVERKIQQEYIDSLKKFFGVDEIWKVLQNPEQQTIMYEEFIKHGLIKRVE